MEGLLAQGSGARVKVLMIDSVDHITGKTGLTLVIEESKDFANFAAIAPTVIERGHGWYEIFLTSANTSTLGDYALHVTATGADPTDVKWQVVTALPGTPTLTQIVNGVWDAMQDQHAVSGSFGWQLQEMEGVIGAFLDMPVSGVPDALLKRDLSAVSGEAARSLLNAIRALRNKTQVVAGVLTVMKEDDATPAWTANVGTDANAEPIVSVDPT